MYQMFIAIFIALFIMTGCGSGGGNTVSADNDSNESFSVDNDTNESLLSSSNFAYETQRAVNISLLMNSGDISSQKQILLYETQKIVRDLGMPGELIVFDALLVEGVSGTNGKYETDLTLGNHIESIWIVIPALAYQQRIDIINNEIILNITKGF